MGSASVTVRIPDNKKVTILAPEDSTLSYAIWGGPPPLSTVLTLYSETLLVTLPAPNFSMPINVIYLVYAVAAVAFIGIHDITTKSLSLLMPADIKP